MRDATPTTSVSDVTRSSSPGSDSRPSTVVNDNARNPDGQNHSMKGCPCAVFTPPLMQVDRPMAIDPYSEIGARKFEH